MCIIKIRVMIHFHVRDKDSCHDPCHVRDKDSCHDPFHVRDKDLCHDPLSCA